MTYHNKLSALLLLGCLSVAKTISHHHHHEALQAGSSNRVVAYYAEWAIYQRNYFVSDLPAAHITHVNYGFAKVTDQLEVGIYDSWAAVEKPFGDDTWDTPIKGNYHALQRMKGQFPNVKTLISVGGWTLSGLFSDVALTSASR